MYCFYVFLFGLTATAVVGTANIPLHLICEVTEHDYFNLTALPWYLNLNAPNCLPLYRSTGPKELSSCEVLMSFCHALEGFGGQCENSSVCQRSLLGSLSLGGYEENPFHDRTAAESEFDASFSNGSSYYTSKNTSCVLHTSIHFYCNHSVTWNVPIGSKGMLQAPDPVSMQYDADTCEMKLAFNFAGACHWKKSNRNAGLGAGTIIVLTFVISLALYFLIGSIGNILSGKSGREIIPQSYFWCNLPAYMKDGVWYLCCCCCHEKKPLSTKEYEPVGQ